MYFQKGWVGHALRSLNSCAECAPSYSPVQIHESRFRHRGWFGAVEMDELAVCMIVLDWDVLCFDKSWIAISYVDLKAVQEQI